MQVKAEEVKMVRECACDSIETAYRGTGATYKYMLPARWATSSQVEVVSIAVNAIYLMYWPITTSPLYAPAEGSPAVSQQGHQRTIDWGVVLFLQADPHSCACLLLCFHPALSLSAYFSCCVPLPLAFYLSRPSLCSPRTGCRLHCQATLAKINSIILIQTDIKRQQANKLFLCRLIISLCFSFGRFNLLFSGPLWVSLTQHVWTEFVSFEADKFGRELCVSRSPHLWDIHSCDKYPTYWQTNVLPQQRRERPEVLRPKVFFCFF